MMILKSFAVLFLLQFSYNFAKADEDCGSSYYCPGDNHCCGVGTDGTPQCCSSTISMYTWVGLVIGIISFVVGVGCLIVKLRKKCCQRNVQPSTATVNLGAGVNVTREQGFWMPVPETQSYPCSNGNLPASPNIQLA